MHTCVTWCIWAFIISSPADRCVNSTRISSVLHELVSDRCGVVVDVVRLPTTAAAAVIWKCILRCTVRHKPAARVKP